MMDFSKLNQAEQAHMNAIIEQKQVEDFMNLFTGLVDRCFKECANDFTTKAVTSRERACVKRCADRFLEHSDRVAKRFTELNEAMYQAAAARQQQQQHQN